MGRCRRLGRADRLLRPIVQGDDGPPLQAAAPVGTGSAREVRVHAGRRRTDLRRCSERREGNRWVDHRQHERSRSPRQATLEAPPPSIPQGGTGGRLTRLLPMCLPASSRTGRLLDDLVAALAVRGTPLDAPTAPDRVRSTSDSVRFGLAPSWSRCADRAFRRGPRSTHGPRRALCAARRAFATTRPPTSTKLHRKLSGPSPQHCRLTTPVDPAQQGRAAGAGSPP